MGILPGLFLFKQPSYLVNPPSSSYRSSEIYNKSNTACHQRRLSERFSRCLLSTSAPLVPDHRYFAYRTDVGGRGGTIGGEDTTAPMRLHLPNDPQSFSRGSIGRPLSRETVDVALFRATVSRFPTDFLRSVDCSRYVTLRLVSSCPGRSEVSRKKIVCRKREEPRRRSRQRVAMFPRHGDQTRLVLRWVKVIPLVAESEINATHRRDWLPNARRNMQMSRPARASSKRGREWKIPTFFLSLSLSLSLSLFRFVSSSFSQFRGFHLISLSLPLLRLFPGTENNHMRFQGPYIYRHSLKILWENYSSPVLLHREKSLTWMLYRIVILN